MLRIKFLKYSTGRLTKDHMHRLFQNLFPGGDTLPFINSIFRIFCVRHTEEYLDFKEFLMAMNVTTLRSEEEKQPPHAYGILAPTMSTYHTSSCGSGGARRVLSNASWRSLSTCMVPPGTTLMWTWWPRRPSRGEGFLLAAVSPHASSRCNDAGGGPGH